MTAEMIVVNLEVLCPPAHLAAPAIPLQDLLTKFTVRLDVEPYRHLPTAAIVHEARLISARKFPRCGAGIIRKYRDSDCSRTSGSFPSIEAPAKKSAQIISRQ